MSNLRRHAVTIIPGDGVGPEVALATRRILDAAAARAGVAFDWEEAEAGASVFLKVAHLRRIAISARPAGDPRQH